jgi:hypothetical protein
VRLHAVVQPRSTVHPHLRTVTILDATGQPVSTCLLNLPHPRLPAHWQVAWVSNVWTAEEFRGQGFGARAVTGACELARKRGSERVLLATSWPDPANSVYTRCGFTYVPESSFLMQRLLREPARHDEVDDAVVELWEDDLAGVAAVVSQIHYDVSEGSVRVSEPLDGEKLFAIQLRDHLGLGHLVVRAASGEIPTSAGWYFPGPDGTLRARISFAAPLRIEMVEAALHTDERTQDHTDRLENIGLSGYGRKGAKGKDRKSNDCGDDGTSGVLAKVS